MVYRWWEELKKQREDSNNGPASAENSEGRLQVGKGTFISEDAILKGNIIIGEECLIGTGVLLRGNVRIHDNVRIGYGVEVKESVIRENTIIGPLCYLGDSLVDKNVYLGALVRTSNHRLDRENVRSWNGEAYEDTGFEKLGAWIKENSSLGIGVVILPGRIVPENSIFSPHIVITRNYPPGVYKMAQNIMKIG